MASGKSLLKSKPLFQSKKVVGQGEVRKNDPMQRARYLAYENPSKSVAESILITQNRLKEHALKTLPEHHRQIPDLEQDRQTKVVGQLKAAEARNRIRLMRIRFQYMKTYEFNNLISCQPTARDAIRLEVFMPPRSHKENPKDPLHRIQRDRVENLLEDDRGLLTNRIP
ncbi:protein LKAAEAR1 [Mixophyes fleayi]|uniref:protein LKAAEAR1 n=1 Tax=Mixophyes fleayi TaxID=3061075 RepID=UPI003F4E0FEB